MPRFDKWREGRALNEKNEVRARWGETTPQLT